MPHEYRVLNLDRDEPWRPEDSIAIGRLAGVDINWLAWFALLPYANEPGFDQTKIAPLLVQYLLQQKGDAFPVVLLGREPFIDPRRFGETVGANRGAAFKAFTDHEEAVHHIEDRARRRTQK